MRVAFKLLLGVIFLGGLSLACKNNSSHSYSKPQQYYLEAFDSIKKYSLRKEQVNIDSLKQYYLGYLHDTMPLKYAYQYLEFAINSIDRHGDFYRPAVVVDMGGMPEDLYSFRGRIMSGKYAYLEILGCQGFDAIAAKTYADSLFKLVVKLNKAEPIGWILDFRGNVGGNMYPMLAGLSPLLGEGILGYNVYLDGTKKPWFAAYRDENTGKMDSLDLMNSVYIFNEVRPIVILVGAGTGSAGEALTLSFRGDPRAIIIGEPTYGVATGNRMVYLADSAALNITDSYMADRNGVYFENRIPPEVVETDAMRIFDQAYLFIEEYGLR